MGNDDQNGHEVTSWPKPLWWTRVMNPRSWWSWWSWWSSVTAVVQWVWWVGMRREEKLLAVFWRTQKRDAPKCFWFMSYSRDSLNTVPSSCKPMGNCLGYCSHATSARGKSLAFAHALDAKRFPIIWRSLFSTQQIPSSRSLSPVWKFPIECLKGIEEVFSLGPRHGSRKNNWQHRPAGTAFEALQLRLDVSVLLNTCVDDVRMRFNQNSARSTSPWSGLLDGHEWFVTFNFGQSDLRIAAPCEHTPRSKHCRWSRWPADQYTEQGSESQIFKCLQGPSTWVLDPAQTSRTFRNPLDPFGIPFLPHILQFRTSLSVNWPSLPIMAMCLNLRLLHAQENSFDPADVSHLRLGEPKTWQGLGSDSDIWTLSGHHLDWVSCNRIDQQTIGAGAYLWNIIEHRNRLHVCFQIKTITKRSRQFHEIPKVCQPEVRILPFSPTSTLPGTAEIQVRPRLNKHIRHHYLLQKKSEISWNANFCT